MTKYSHEKNVAATTTKFKVKMQQVTKKVAEEQFQNIWGAEVIYEEKSTK